MAYRNSLHGRKVQYDDRLIYLNGRPYSGELRGRGVDFYVDSARDGAGGENPDEGMGTIDEAFARCTANVGDRIIVLPNHAETISAADGISADVAGVSVLGLGHYNQRPRVLMDTAATVDVNISAADVSIHNIEFAAGFADIVRCIQITAKGAWLDAIVFTDDAATENWLTPIKGTGTTDNEIDGLRVTDCEWFSPDAACVEFIELNADVKSSRVVGNLVSTEGTASPLILCATGKDLQEVAVLWNFLSSKTASGNLFISNDTASPNNSGIIAHNRCGHADVTGAHTMGAVGGCRFFDNLSVSTDALSGFVLPAIDVDL